MEEEKLRYIGKMVDLSLKVDYTGRGVIDFLWNAASAAMEEPITLSAAKRLKKTFSNGPDYVTLVTGTMMKKGVPKVQTETDGPIGAAVLARAIWRAFGTLPIVVTIEAAINVIAAAVRAVGFADYYCPIEKIESITADQRFLKTPTAIVTFLPPGISQANEMAEAFARTGNVGAFISVEMVGRNQFGIAHSVSGISKDNNMLPWFDKLFEIAQKYGLLSIGIGDGGNEIGMGNIKEILDTTLPSARCKCHCGGTIVPVQTVDVIIPALISNWGAYGVALCIAAELERPDIFHNTEMENGILDAVVSAGAVDGTTSLVEHCVDGLSREANASYVELLRTLLLNNLQQWGSR